MTDAFQIVFWLAAGIAALAIVIVAFLREIPLRTGAEQAVATAEKASPGTSVGAPAD
jgi:hypothetical protein